MGFLSSKEQKTASTFLLVIWGTLLIAARYFETEFPPLAKTISILNRKYPFLLLVFLGLSGLLFIRESINHDRNQRQSKDNVIVSMSAEELLKEIKNLEEDMVHHAQSHEQGNSFHTPIVMEDSMEKAVVQSLHSLAEKCSTNYAPSTEKTVRHNVDHTLSLLSQEAAYIALRTFASSDAIISASLSVLAIISGDVQVRERTRDQAEIYGVHVPISRIQSSLERAKNAIDPTEESEQHSAQVQSKGCLFLGAIADGDAVISKNVVEEDGLCAILNACEWYRVHSEVAKWSLWAIFVLCYDNPGNKAYLIHLDGIKKVSRTLKEMIDNADVARHGIAILFDSLREHGIAGNIDTGKLRAIALNEGLHSILQQAMIQHPHSVEIILMGKQMLQATGGYKEEVS